MVELFRQTILRGFFFLGKKQNITVDVMFKHAFGFMYFSESSIKGVELVFLKSGLNSGKLILNIN